MAALSIYYEKSSGWVGLMVPGILWIIGVVALFFCPQVRHRTAPKSNAHEIDKPCCDISTQTCAASTDCGGSNMLQM